MVSNMWLFLLHKTTHHYQFFLPNFRILTQVVAEKSLTENVHMHFLRVTEGKNENLKKGRQNEDKGLNFHLHNTLCLPESVHKI